MEAESNGFGEAWRRFWSGQHRIYVNERHRQVHYRQVAADLRSIVQEWGGERRPRFLDYGCGEALEAARLAELCQRLYLYDAAGPVRERLEQRYAGHPTIVVLDPVALDGLGAGGVDIIVANSVIQYLGGEELAAILDRCRGWLGADGLLVLADVVPPGGNLVADVKGLLLTALRHGFLAAALWSLMVDLFSGYAGLRRRWGLATYDEPAMIAIFAGHGFAATRRPRNFGFNLTRMTFLARPTG